MRGRGGDLDGLSRSREEIGNNDSRSSGGPLPLHGLTTVLDSALRSENMF